MAYSASSDGSAIVTGLWIAAVFGLCLFRAATQSITCDEALTYQWFVAHPWREVFRWWDANNHVLYTVLAKLSVDGLGASELTLRLPALAGAAAYLVAVRALCRALFGTGTAGLLALALATTHPLVLDYLVAARGYGLGLALLTGALLLLLRGEGAVDATGEVRRRLAASACLGLAVCSNLAYLYPAATTIALAGGLRLGRWRHLVLPGLLLSASILVPVVTPRAKLADFYAGSPSFAGLARDLVDSFAGRTRVPPFPPAVSYLAAGVCVGLLLWVFVAGAWRAAGEPRPREDVARVIVAGVPLGSLLLAAMAHGLVGLPYPFARSALYVIPLSLLAFVLLGRSARSVAARVVAGATVAACLALQLAQLDTTSFRDFRYDAGSRDVFRALEAYRSSTGRPKIRVGAPGFRLPSLEFYQALAGTEHFEYVTADLDRLDGMDAGVVGAGEAAAHAAGFVAWYREPVSGTTLLVRR